MGGETEFSASPFNHAFSYQTVRRKLVGEILFLLGETQNERANAGRSQPSSQADGGSLDGVLLVLSGLGGPG